MAFQLLTVPSHSMTQPQLDAVIALCSEVFDMDYAAMMDLPLTRVHVLGAIDGRLVSHALWLERRLRVGGGPWLNAAYIEGVATHPDHRGRGYGSAVMRRVAQEISGFDLGALSPAVPEWYERLGWERWRGPLLIEKDGVVEATSYEDELVMVYRTPRTGALDLTASLTGEWRSFEPW